MPGAVLLHLPVTPLPLSKPPLIVVIVLIGTVDFYLVYIVSNGFSSEVRFFFVNT